MYIIIPYQLFLLSLYTSRYPVGNSQRHVFFQKMPALTMDIIIEHGTRKVTQDELSFNGTEQIKELLKIIEGEATIMFLLTTRIGWVKEKESVFTVSLSDNLQSITTADLNMLQTLMNLVIELVAVIVHDNTRVAARGAIIPLPTT